MLKAISEISVPKVVEKLVADSQQGGDKEGTEQTKPTDSEATKQLPPKQSKQQQHTSKPKRPIIKGIIINPPKGSSSKKPKPSEPEPEGRGKGIATTEPNPKATPDTSKDAEIAKKLAEEERIKASAVREELQIKASEVRIWPVWTRAKITKVALPEADPYWYIQLLRKE